jgi:uncharacterized membrane protein
MEKFALGFLIFFGAHCISLVAPAWRDRIAERLGKRKWQGIYSIVSLAGLYLLVSGFAAARDSAGIVYATPPSFHYIAAILMLPVFTLVLAAVMPGRIRARVQHPLLLATAIWSAAHLLTNGSVADLLLFGGFLAWSVAVRISLGRRPSRVTFALRASALNDAVALVGGLALYAVFLLWLHARLFGVAPLGISFSFSS